MRAHLIVSFTLTTTLCLACGNPQEDIANTDMPSDGETFSSAVDETPPATDDRRSVLEQSEERAQVRELGLRIIQSYFDNNPQAFIDMIADDLPQIGREGETMDGAYFRELVEHAEPYPSGEDLTMYSMEQYHEIFDPLVVTYDEAVEYFDFPAVTNGGWIPEPDDFIYLGGYLRDGFTEEDKFIRDGLNSFVFGKRDGIWLFVGFVS